MTQGTRALRACPLTSTLIRHAGNQVRTLTSLTNMRQLAPVLENMTATLGQKSVKAFYLWIFNTVDTELARRVMGLEKKAEVGGQRTEGGDQKTEDSRQSAAGRRGNEQL